jgi:hypothetical protein
MDPFLALFWAALQAAASECGRLLTVLLTGWLVRAPSPAPPHDRVVNQGEEAPRPFAETNVLELLQRLEDGLQQEKEDEDGEAYR